MERKHPLAKCEIDDCDNRVVARDLCNKHWKRWRKYGDPNITAFPNALYLPTRNATPMERFLHKVQKTSCGHWIWLGADDADTGYGRFYFDGRVIDAHVASYVLHKGLVPTGKEIDHECRIKLCVNPDCLAAVTHSENLWRSPLFNGNKTHCIHGHAYTEENTAIHHGRRECRECSSQRNREAQLQMREWAARPKTIAKRP